MYSNLPKASTSPKCTHFLRQNLTLTLPSNQWGLPNIPLLNKKGQFNSRHDLFTFIRITKIIIRVHESFPGRWPKPGVLYEEWKSFSECLNFDVQNSLVWSCHDRGRRAEYQDLFIQTCFEALTELTRWPCLHKIKKSHESLSLSPSHAPSLLLPVCWNCFSVYLA